MANKAKIKDKKTPLYEITDSNETKISLRKISGAETDTSSFKIKDSEENKENLCEVTSHDETNKKKNKKKRRKKTTCDEASESEILIRKKCYDEKANCEAGEPSNASEKKIEDPKVSIYEIRKSDGKDVVVKALSQTDIAKIMRDGSPLHKLEVPTYTIQDYNEIKENIEDKEVTVYNVIRKPGTDESEVIIKKSLHKEMFDKANKSEVAVKEQCLHEKTTSDEANESEVPVKEKSFDEEAISNRQNNSEIAVKEQSLHEKTTSDEANESEVPVKEKSFDEEAISNKQNNSEIAVKEQSLPEKTTSDEANESEVPVKETSFDEEAISNRQNNSEIAVKEQSLPEKTTSDEANESEVPVKKTSFDEEAISNRQNNSEIAVKEQSLPEKTTSDEANESEVPVKKTSFDEEAISNRQNNVCPFTIKDDILIGVNVSDTVYNLHIGNLILQAFNTEPLFIGQVDVTSGEQITFQQMKENSVKCALWLEKILGNKNKNNNTYDDLITICTHDPTIAYIPYLATLYLGAMVNPWKEEYFENDVRILYFLQQNLPNVIFVDDHNVQKLQNNVDILKKYNSRCDPIIVVFGEVEGFHSLKTILATEVDKKIIDEFSCQTSYNHLDTAIVIYSSNTVSYAEAQIPYFAFASSSNFDVPLMAYGEIGMWYGCLCWTHSLLLTVRAIISFTTALKIPTSLFSEEHVYEMIEKYKVTWMFLESSMCEKMFLTDIMVGRYNISSLKQFLFGDMPINEGIHEDFVVYLPSVSVTQVYCDPIAGVIAFQRDSGSLRSSGHVSKNIKVAIIDTDTKKVVGANVRGEIWCKSPYMYEIISVFKKPDPKMDSQFEDWYCTGDFGFYDENGDIYIVDKIRHLIRYKNWIVSASEIEEMLLQDWNVAEAVVLPIPVPNDGQHPAAFVRKVLGAKVTAQELIVHIENTMADCCRLRGGVYFVQEFKRLPDGKIDRARIKFDASWQILNKMNKEPEKSTTNKPVMETGL